MEGRNLSPSKQIFGKITLISASFSAVEASGAAVGKDGSEAMIGRLLDPRSQDCLELEESEYCSGGMAT